ncbi:CBS domain-containing protein CBSX3, mitochondrial [Fagus crenata]|uniref:CBS domain-containing protein n=1 Tax=Fagus sylvatica TaxID=28930 RepID=A0A2N9GMT2_FAGSY
MQGIVRAIRSCQEILKAAILQHSHGRGASKAANLFAFGRITSSSSAQLKGLENVTVAEVLMTKGEEKTGSWLWCRTDDAVIDAVKNMGKNNIGSLVVLKPGEEHIAGIITERENRIRHVPVIDGKIVGMISIVDVVRAVVEQQSGELKQLNEFIHGDYY